MKCCVSIDVGTWTNWLTFELDPDYSPDARTGLLSPISYALQRGMLLRRENPTYRYWSPVAAGFIHREPWTTLSEVHSLDWLPLVHKFTRWFQFHSTSVDISCSNKSVSQDRRVTFSFVFTKWLDRCNLSYQNKFILSAKFKWNKMGLMQRIVSIFSRKSAGTDRPVCEIVRETDQDAVIIVFKFTFFLDTALEIVIFSRHSAVG